MKSNYFLTNIILAIAIDPEDINLTTLGIEVLNLVKKKAVQNIIFDLALLEVITSDDIKYIQSLVNMFRLNNIDVIVCNINPYSASILFHFIDEITFKTALDVQSAIDVFKNK